MCAVTAKEEEKGIDINEFSSWRRFVRVTARILRLSEKIRLRKHGQEGREGPLAPEELIGAEQIWIKKAQESLHGYHGKGEFASLSPFVDDKGIMRVGGRVDAALVSYDTRHPILLPSDHRVAFLITHHIHDKGHPRSRRPPYSKDKTQVLDFEGEQAQQNHKESMRTL